MSGPKYMNRDNDPFTGEVFEVTLSTLSGEGIGFTRELFEAAIARIKSELPRPGEAALLGDPPALLGEVDIEMTVALVVDAVCEVLIEKMRS